MTPNQTVSSVRLIKKENALGVRIKELPDSLPTLSQLKTDTHFSGADEENSDSTSGRFESLTIKEDAMEDEAEDEGLPTFPYERLKVSSADPVQEIDATQREVIILALLRKDT